MKITIMNRSVYHKVGFVEVEVPDNLKKEEVLDYLNENSQMYEYEMDSAINEADYEYGSGIGEYRGMDEDVDSEWRFEYEGDEEGDGYVGGHL